VETAQKAHITADLGLVGRLDGDVLRGSAEIGPHLLVPGAGCLRISVLAAWLDVLAGLLAVDLMRPRVPVTLDLSIELPRPATGLRRVDAVARVLKAGRSVAVTEIDFTADGSDEPVAIGTASFMAAPDASLTVPSLADNLEHINANRGRLAVPYADRAGIELRAPGVAALPRRVDGLNAAGTINGGLLALVVEEAARSAAGGGTLSSLVLHYLRPGRVGPAVATATLHGELGRVDVVDEGAEDRLTVVATTRTFRPDA
jgi:acyl-coenzyme A thioesterase PaaI-like protein